MFTFLTLATLALSAASAANAAVVPRATAPSDYRSDILEVRLDDRNQEALY